MTTEDSSTKQARFEVPKEFDETLFSVKDDCTGFHPKIFQDVDDEEDTEIWLIQAPIGLDPNELNGKTMTLDRPKMLKFKETNECYEMKFSNEISDRFKSNVVMLPDLKSGKLKPLLKPIDGFLSICKSLDIPEINYPEVALQQPIIPEGLKIRYTPFGSDKPTKLKNSKRGKRKEQKRTAEAEIDVASEVLSFVDMAQVDSPTKKKKCKKRSICPQDNSDLESEQATISDITGSDNSPFKMKRHKKRDKSPQVYIDWTSDQDIFIQPTEYVKSPSKKKKIRDVSPIETFDWASEQHSFIETTEVQNSAQKKKKKKKPF